MDTSEQRLTRIENAIEALVGMQAQHDLQIAENAKLFRKTEELIAKNAEQIGMNSGQIGKHEAALRDLILISRTLIEAQRDTDKQIKEMGANLDIRLRALANGIDDFRAAVDAFLRGLHKPNGNR